jgi:hypothetical protein
MQLLYSMVLVINIQSSLLLLMTLFFVGTPYCPVQFSPGNVAHCLNGWIETTAITITDVIARDIRIP